MKIDIDEYAEGAILLDGLEGAIIVITEEFGNVPRILYSKEKILLILMERDGMDNLEAEEFYYYNIVGLYAGEQNAIFLDVPINMIKNNDEWEYHEN